MPLESFCKVREMKEGEREEEFPEGGCPSSVSSRRLWVGGGRSSRKRLVLWSRLRCGVEDILAAFCVTLEDGIVYEISRVIG